MASATAYLSVTLVAPVNAATALDAAEGVHRALFYGAGGAQRAAQRAAASSFRSITEISGFDMNVFHSSPVR